MKYVLLCHVCYIHKPIAEAYSEIFDKAVSEYNSKQKRSDRMIKTGYYEHLFNVLTFPLYYRRQRGHT